MRKTSFFKKYLKKKRPLLLLVILIPILIFTVYNLIFLYRIFPGIAIGQVNVGGKNPKEAVVFLSEKVTPPEKLILVGQTQNFEIDLASINFSYNFSASIQAAYDYDRTGNIFYDFYQRAKAPLRSVTLGLRFNLDEEKLTQNLSVISGQVAVDPVLPSAKLVKGKVVIDKGKEGSQIDTKLLRIEVGQRLASLDSSPIIIPTKTIDPTLTDQEADSFKKRAENLIGKTLNVNFEFQNFPYKGGSFFELLAPRGGYDEAKIAEEIQNIVKEVDRDSQNPTFLFESGRVHEFAPAKDGVKTNMDEFKQKFIESLTRLEAGEEKHIAFEVPVNRTPPKIQTADVNNLGIKELIGRGVSRFRGSIPSRIYNISLAASRLNGILIKPGDTFSFNDALGDVSKLTGYKEAFIIKDGKTVLGDGGGVCQVSSTFFRAVLDSGLPIVERRAHSYRVGYYEQDSPPGFDATVYSPTTDLKIKNDTPAHILIQAHANTKTATLVFEFYGTKDGRVAKTTKPVVSDVVAPPDDLYQDDPTLPLGKTKQIDFKAWGAKVVFNYTVERAGETIYQKTFISNYRPWQAIYLRGTGPTQ